MNVLAIGCHPDDLEINCGGTLARLVAEGHNLYMCHVTNGNMGDVNLSPEEIAKIRTLEAENAGAVIGAKKVYNVDEGDCVVRSEDKNALRKIVKIIRETRPDFIITEDPNDYMEDHRQVAKLVFEASFTSSVPHMFPEYPVYPLVPPLYYMDSEDALGFDAEDYVDITDYMEQKLAAVACHKSQYEWLSEHDGIDFLETTSAFSRFRGLQCGVKYAEAFRVCHTWPRQTTKRFLP